jgi:hypothetical protein
VRPASAVHPPMLKPLAARIPETRESTPGSFCTRQLRTCLDEIRAECQFAAGPGRQPVKRKSYTLLVRLQAWWRSVVQDVGHGLLSGRSSRVNGLRQWWWSPRRRTVHFVCSRAEVSVRHPYRSGTPRECSHSRALVLSSIGLGRPLPSDLFGDEVTADELAHRIVWRETTRERVARERAWVDR